MFAANILICFRPRDSTPAIFSDMQKIHLFSTLVFSATIVTNWKAFDNSWIAEKHEGYNLIYTSADKGNIKEYNKLIENGADSVKTFFNSSYSKTFDIFIHPNRRSLDSTWQRDWNMPGFKSECWMVASGVASRLDIISPKVWDKEACEHSYAESKKTQQVITHELVHVFHGQVNTSPYFSSVEGIDWFVEGLATYASGQCDSLRIAEIKEAIFENKIPNSLDSFWTGNLRYGLSGSIVMYIDKKYGRVKLKGLLPFNKKPEILSTLNTTEAGLIGNWKKYMQQL
jgi:hypothetical protein